MYKLPDDLKYTIQHAWLEDIGNHNYRVGITDFAQDELGDVIFIEPPEKGREYSQVDACGVIESVKSTSDLYCPLSGTIIEVNATLNDSPELLNSEPYNEGWIFIISANNEVEFDELIDAKAYSELTEGG